MKSKTITHLVTAPQGAVNIIRVSGEEAYPIVQKLTNLNLATLAPNTINYGVIQTPEQRIDEVLISLFRAPHSFTGEDVVEINTHGGTYIAFKILGLLVQEGAVLAQRGEFTKRAFLNGKIDLVQAQAINDLICSRSDLQHQIAINQLQKQHLNIVGPLQDRLLTIISNIAVHLDYPEYDDLPDITYQGLHQEVKTLQQEITQIVGQVEMVISSKNPIKTAIVGQSNVGKSSLLNCLLQKDKAIVSDIAGTTRDIVEGEITIDGLLFQLLDTAGIREEADTLEKIGITKTYQALTEADLVIVVIDATVGMDACNTELLAKAQLAPRHLVVYNKSDLRYIPEAINISALRGEISELRTALQEIYQSHSYQPSIYALASHLQLAKLQSTITQLQQALLAIEQQVAVDLVELELKLAYEELTGVYQNQPEEEFLNQMFSKFCLGK